MSDEEIDWDLVYDPEDRPGMDEEPDFEEEFNEALKQHYQEEDQYDIERREEP